MSGATLVISEANPCIKEIAKLFWSLISKGSGATSELTIWHQFAEYLILIQTVDKICFFI